MIEKGVGINPSEQYLTQLCEKTFLSLWSYPNAYRKRAKELCDLLVVVGNNVVIFSDKLCEYPNSGNSDLDWSRWFRRAISDSAQQLWRAENWIKSNPERIFLDSQCEQKLPINIHINNQTEFHLVVVAHGALQACYNKLGGSGSLMFCNEIEGIENHTRPFTVGDIDRRKNFIHVLDDNTLDILLQNRDTISDFTAYLRKRKRFLRSDKTIFIPGEEDLLAYYLTEYNDDNEHDFILPEELKNEKRIAFNEGEWLRFQNHPKRISQLRSNAISYMWDAMTEAFCKHAANGTQYKSSGGFSESEQAIRMLALESRLDRRILAESLKETILKVPSDKRGIRVIQMHRTGFYYAFVLLPYGKEFPDWTYEKYRTARGNFLEAVCLVIKLDYPDANHIVGIAMPSGLDLNGRSEDLIYFDCSGWNEELEEQAKRDKSEFGILIKPQKFERVTHEYPIA